MTFHCSWHLVNDHLPHSMISIFAVCTMLLRLRVVPHFSSSPFLAWGDFLARSRFAALLSLRKNGGLLVVYMLLWIYEELYWQLETTHILTWRLYAINYLPQSEGAWNSSRKRPPCGLILVTTPPVSVHSVLHFGCSGIWEVRLYLTQRTLSNLL